MSIYNYQFELSSCQNFQKRSFDLFFSLFGLVALWWLIFLAFIFSSIETRGSGFFVQQRIGRHGKTINVFKIKTMKMIDGVNSNVTQAGDPRVTYWGAFFRRTKIDELPQLWNVLKGDMSFVGPRPDVPGFADKLEGASRSVLSLRPGITGPATLEYRNEESLLAEQDYPERFNSDVIYPHKVELNIKYIKEWTLIKDIYYIIKTVQG